MKKKITNPGFKKIIRIFDKNSHKALADLIALRDEHLNEAEPLVLFNPVTYLEKKKNQKLLY